MAVAATLGKLRDVAVEGGHPLRTVLWLVVTGDEADVCDTDPGHPVAVTVTAALRTMIEVWRGDVSWDVALRAGDITLHGPKALCRALPGWFTRPGLRGRRADALPGGRRGVSGTYDSSW